MLIYEKRDKIKFKINLSEEIVTTVKQADVKYSTLGCDSSAIARAAAERQQDLELPICFRLYPTLFDQVRNEALEFDEQTKEYYVFIHPSLANGNFNKFVPI